MSQQALTFFQNKNWPFWRLERGGSGDKKGERVDANESQDFDESENELIQTLEILQPGNYVLKVRPADKADNGQKTFEFKIKSTVGISDKSISAPSVSKEDQIRAQIYKEVRREVDIENKIEKLERICEQQQTEIEELKRLLTNKDSDDDDEGPSVLQKISEQAQHLPGLLDGLKAITNVTK